MSSQQLSRKSLRENAADDASAHLANYGPCSIFQSFTTVPILAQSQMLPNRLRICFSRLAHKVLLLPLIVGRTRIDVSGQSYFRKVD